MTITLWKPEPNTINHQALGKLAEEAAELAKTCIRALIQGLDETNPATGRSNREEIADEIADVTAATIFVDNVTGIGYDTNRTRAKLDGFKEWTALLHADAKQNSQDRRATGHGMALAASIIMRGHGEETYAREILSAGGYYSSADLERDGVDEYDISILAPIFSDEA